jgi:hypothetical protein
MQIRNARLHVRLVALSVAAALITPAGVALGAPPAPNLYQLAGARVHVSYAASGIDGKAHLEYQDEHMTMHFKGDEIHVTKTEVGTLLTVYLRRTIDAGATTFTLLLPDVALPGPGASLRIETMGITTMHRFSIVPAFNSGQREVYSFTPLAGTAHLVAF